MAAKTQGTWVATDRIGIPPLSNVDTTKVADLGTRVKAKDVGSTTGYGEADFVYVAGATGLAAGDVVNIGSGYVVSKVTARSKGSVAVMISAVDAATKYGWAQRRGKGVAKCDAGISDGAALYIDGTDGRVDDTAVAGDCIAGMVAASTDDTNTCLVILAEPSTADYDNA